MVLAAEHPGFFTAGFCPRSCVGGCGWLQVSLASFGERGDGGSAKRANDVVSSAVQGIPFDLPAKPAMPIPFNTAPW